MPLGKPTFFDYYLDIEKREWVAYEWMVPEYIHNRETKFTEIMVPTIDTVRTTWLLRLMNDVSAFFLQFTLQIQIVLF